MISRVFSSKFLTSLRSANRCSCELTSLKSFLNSRQSTFLRLASSVEPEEYTAVAEGQSEPTGSAVSVEEDAPRSTPDGNLGNESAKEQPGEISAASPVTEPAGRPAGKGKYQWNKERTEREIRRAKYVRDEKNRHVWQSSNEVRQKNRGVLPTEQSNPARGSLGHRSPARASIKLHFPISLANFGRLTSRRDVQRLLKDCALSTEDIRLAYDVSTLLPKAFYANLRTAETQKRALSYNGTLIAGRPIRISAVSIHEMQEAILSPLAMGSKGRFIVVQGIQENANLEDIVKFFEGYELMGNPVTLMKKPEENNGAREYERRSTINRSSRSAAVVHSASIRALVRFATTEEAHRAMRSRQCCFLLNAPVTLRLLQ